MKKVKARKTAAVVALAAAIVGVGGLQSAPEGKAAVAAAADCNISVMDTGEVSRGMTGTALSVTQGTEPETFAVEVLGVLKDGIAPGRDMIVVNVSGGIWDQTGTWAGASGSPVYLPDPVTGQAELAGAVAYGLAGGASTLAGLTPAGDMVDLLDPGPVARAPLADWRVAVPRTLATRMAEAADVSLAQVETGFSRLKTPLSVSGLNARGFARLRQAIARQDLPFIPYAGSSSSAVAADETVPLGPGDSFAGALSLGDVTAAGIGTTTFVCFDQAVAFGHPFNFTGETTMAARAADTITIVQDPIFGSYKLANVDWECRHGHAGSAGRDHGRPGAGPERRSRDLDGDRPRSRPLPERRERRRVPRLRAVPRGRTSAGERRHHHRPARARQRGRCLHDHGALAAAAGRGRSPARATMSPTGTSRSSRLRTSGSALDLLSSFDGEDIAITSVDVPRLDVEKAVELYQLKRVLVWNGHAYVRPTFVRRRPGGLIRLRAELTARHRPGVQIVNLSLRVPANARRSGFIEVLGGGSLFGPEIPCFFDDFEDCGEEAPQPTFDGVLAALRNQPRGDALVARLRLGSTSAVRAQGSKRQDAVVRGFRTFEFELIRR